MTEGPPIDIVVLGGDAHGIPTDEYVTALRERLPEHDVEHARTPAARRDLVPQARIVTGDDLPEDLIDRAEHLRLFASIGAGVDAETVRRFVERDVAVTNASGVHGSTIAEHVLAVVLSFVRRLDVGRRRHERREWRHYQCDELYGSTVTIVGLGAIGEAVAERLEGFGVETIGVRYSPEKGGPTDEVIGFDTEDFHDALADTDYLVLACPLTETTRGLIGADELAVLPPDAMVVNVARGPIVDTDALVASLRKNSLGGAALDVTDPEPLPEAHPLWTFENVLVTPHLSGHTPRYWQLRADILARNVRRLDEDEDAVDDLENRVDVDDSGEIVF